MRFKCTCAYDGTDFVGWQSQACGNALQDLFEAILSQIFKGPIRVHGSSRTDSGVHAHAQIFHFDAEWAHPIDALHRAMNTLLPKSVQLISIAIAPENFHARYDAKGKRYVYECTRGWADPFTARYCYSFGNRDLDIDAMNAGAAFLIGRHDFSAFSNVRADGTRENPVKTIWQVEWVRIGPRFRMITEGSGYLYKMVRAFAGTLLEVASGKIKPEDIRDFLQGCKRTKEVVTAPAHGLFLDRVIY
jgi:tRNA pseudouridine38-40 synthase